MDVSTHRFSKGVKEALRDTNLQNALEDATVRFGKLRRQAFDTLPEGEALRDRARQIKEKTIAELDGYLEMLSRSVERVGGHVHWARDGAEARQIVVDLARRYGVRLAVKSKSMTRGWPAERSAVARAIWDDVRTTTVNRRMHLPIHDGDPAGI